MQIFKDIFQLFFPRICIHCSKQLLPPEVLLCVCCLHQLPVIHYNETTRKMLQDIFYGRIAVENVFALLYYHKIGISKKIIHQLKYFGKEDIGVFLGKWIANALQREGFCDTIDCIVPVPLHPKKRRKRGYNQLTKFGETLSEILQIEYQPDVLKRKRSLKTQAFKHRFERFSDAKIKFELENTLLFKNKHVLLIDDILTTGATLVSCCEELLKTENIKISICTIAYTEKG